MNSAGLVPFGRALEAFHEGDRDARLDLRWDPGEEGSLPVSTFFEAPGASIVEVRAVEATRGRVLDVGGGSGRFGLALLARGHTVVGLDILPEAVAVMKARGLDARLGTVEDGIPPGSADTILVMMNGTTLAGTLEGLRPLLGALGKGLAEGGRILIDSTDPHHPESGWDPPADGRAAGELHLQMGFRGEWAPPIPQLFVGPDVLAAEVRAVGFEMAVIAEEGDGRYLAELSPRTAPDSAVDAPVPGPENAAGR